MAATQRNSSLERHASYQEHVQGAFLIQTRKRHHLLAVFSPILYITNSPEPLFPEIRRVLVQTPLPFRSMTAVRCGRGCTFVAPLILYSTRWCPSAKAMSGVNFCAIRSRPSPLCTDQPRKATIVRDLATLWEKQYIVPLFMARKAYNPDIKGPCWPCKSLPLTSPSLFCPSFSLSQFNSVVSSQSWCPRAVQLGPPVFFSLCLITL